METNHLIVVSGLIEKDGKILLVQEGKKVAKGLWNLPGGWIDYKESVFDAGKREVKEETGFDIELDGLVGIYVSPSIHIDGLTVLRIVFKGHIVGGSLKIPEDELMDAKWFTAEEALAMPDSKLRNIRSTIEDYNTGKVYPLDVLRGVK